MHVDGLTELSKVSGTILIMALMLFSRCKNTWFYVFSYFPFGFEGRIWDLIVSVPDHCLSF